MGSLLMVRGCIDSHDYHAFSYSPLPDHESLDCSSKMCKTFFCLGELGEREHQALLGKNKSLFFARSFPYSNTINCEV